MEPLVHSSSYNKEKVATGDHGQCKKRPRGSDFSPGPTPRDLCIKQTRNNMENILKDQKTWVMFWGGNAGFRLTSGQHPREDWNSIAKTWPVMLMVETQTPERARTSTGNLSSSPACYKQRTT